MSSAAVTTTTVIPSDSDEKYATKDYVDENSVLPSYQSDEPGRNVGGLEARIRQEMETRIRQEMEEKIRAEMESKIRADALLVKQQQEKEEAKRIVKEAKRRWEKMIEQRQKGVLEQVEESMKPLIQSAQDRRAKSNPNGVQMMNHVIDVFNTFSAKIREVIQQKQVLYYWATPGPWVEDGRDALRMKGPLAPNAYGGMVEKPVISAYNKQFQYITPTHMGVCDVLVRDSDCATEIEFYPFYWFDSELGARELTILDQIWPNTIPIPPKKHIYGFDQGIGLSANLTVPNITRFSKSTRYVSSIKGSSEFDSLLRLIPGGYKNGPWRPIHGFIGPYINEETFEISPFPPSM